MTDHEQYHKLLYYAYETAYWDMFQSINRSSLTEEQRNNIIRTRKYLEGSPYEPLADAFAALLASAKAQHDAVIKARSVAWKEFAAEAERDAKSAEEERKLKWSSIRETVMVVVLVFVVFGAMMWGIITSVDNNNREVYQKRNRP